jgi:anti-sigma regulatory factor (Ser/Thr protein kinase)
MSKILTRIVAVFLIACLIEGPVTGSIDPAGAGFHLHPQSESHFTSQALAVEPPFIPACTHGGPDFRVVKQLIKVLHEHQNLPAFNEDTNTTINRKNALDALWENLKSLPESGWTGHTERLKKSVQEAERLGYQAFTWSLWDWQDDADYATQAFVLEERNQTLVLNKVIRWLKDHAIRDQSHAVELVKNFRRYTTAAVLLVRIIHDRVEMIAMDKGPGLQDRNLHISARERDMRFSDATAGINTGLGEGLKIIQGAPNFRAESDPGRGSRITIEFIPPAPRPILRAA